MKLFDNTKVNYYEKNMPFACQTNIENGIKILSWKESNLPVLTKEDFMDAFTEFTPIVYFAPEEFEVDGVKGNFKSWQNFGKWIVTLNKNRDVLSDDTKKKLVALTAGLNTKEKIRKVYEYMQNRTRYVSIQVGIGGWQPFDAKTVDRLAYGDCKALSNYTFAMLKTVGVPVNYTLIRAGADAAPIQTDFPSQLFNHAIITAPLEHDTLFLECTSSYLPYTHNGSFTDDRNALMITDSGGVLIHTRIYRPEENTIVKNINVILQTDGSGSANASITYSGCCFDKPKYLSASSNEDIKKRLYEQISIPNYTISGFAFQQEDSTKPVIKEKVQLTLDNYAQAKDNRLTLPLNLMDRIIEIPNITESRKCDILIRRPQINYDTIKYTLPEGYTVDRVPSEVKFESACGVYSSSCQISENTLIYTREFYLKKGRFKPQDASNFTAFYIKVINADQIKITLKRQ